MNGHSLALHQQLATCPKGYTVISLPYFFFFASKLHTERCGMVSMEPTGGLQTELPRAKAGELSSGGRTQPGPGDLGTCSCFNLSKT